MYGGIFHSHFHKQSLIRAFARRLTTLWLLSYCPNSILSFYCRSSCDYTLFRMQYCWKLHVAAHILLTCIKPYSVLKTIIWYVLELPFYTGFTVSIFCVSFSWRFGLLFDRGFCWPCTLAIGKVSAHLLRPITTKSILKYPLR